MAKIHNPNKFTELKQKSAADLRKFDINATGGQGGSGTKNYLITESGSLQNSNFEEGLGDWTNYDDTGAFVDGTGGSPSVISVAQTQVAGEVLEGDASLKISKSASDGSGEGASVVTRTIDKLDLGRDQNLRIYVDATDANYTAGDLSIHVYGIDSDNASNNKELIVRNTDGTTNPTIPQGAGYIDAVVTGSNDNIDQMRVAVHLESDSATGSAWDVFVDDVRLGPSGQAIGYSERLVDTKILSSNITSTGDVSDLTDSVNIKEGKRYKVLGKLYMDTSSSGGFEVKFYNGSSSTGTAIDSARLAHNNTFTIQETRHISFEFTANSEEALTVNVVAATGTLFGNSTRESGGSYLQIIEVTEGNILSTTEAALSTLFARYKTATAQSIGNSDTTILYGTKEEDQWGVYNTSTGDLTIPRKGKYTIKAASALDSTNFDTGERAILRIKVNGTTKAQAIFEAQSGDQATTAQQIPLRAELTDRFSEGDVITVTLTQDFTTTENLNGLDTMNVLEVLGEPDFSVFGVQGVFDTIEQESSEETVPSIGVWVAMTDNEVTPPAGTWKLHGICKFTNSGSAGYSRVRGRWASADGDDTSTTPASPTKVAGQDEVVNSSSSGNIIDVHMMPIVVSTDGSNTYYLVPRSDGGTAANQRVTTYIWAERKQ